MKIEKVKLNKLKLDNKNARKHNAKNISELERSLKEFGQHRALVVQRGTNKILIGNGMYQAMLNLGFDEADVYFVDDDDKTAVKRAIADNRTGELAEWDADMLNELMADFAKLGDFDVPGFSDDEVKFIADIETDAYLAEKSNHDTEAAEEAEENSKTDGYYGDERERTFNIYRLYEYDAERTAGNYNMPIVAACHEMPEALIPFNYVKSIIDKNKESEFNKYVHFFLDDYQFERIWHDPHKYIDLISNFAGAIMPDFSTYDNMPKAMKIWNMYRAKLISQIMQDYGMNVIPLIRGSEDFYLDGFEQGGIVALSTVGIFGSVEMRAKWSDGLDAAFDKLRPEGILLYGEDIGYDFGSIPVKHFKNTAFNGGS